MYKRYDWIIKLKLNTKELKQAIPLLVIAAATKNDISEYSDVILNLEQNKLSLTTLNGFKLSKKVFDVVYSGSELQVVLPFKILKDIHTNIRATHPQNFVYVILNITKNFFNFGVGDRSVQGRLISKQYPNQEKLNLIMDLPFANEIIIERELLYKAIKLLSCDKKESIIKLIPTHSLDEFKLGVVLADDVEGIIKYLPTVKCTLEKTKLLKTNLILPILQKLPYEFIVIKIDYNKYAMFDSTPFVITPFHNDTFRYLAFTQQSKLKLPLDKPIKL